MCHRRLRTLLVCFVLVVSSLHVAVAAEVTFRKIAIDVRSQHNSADAIDVDRDGKLDVVSGGWWYQAPSWKRHKVRDVQMIRGRFDDYSCSALDVNQDGWTDFVSANYRSKSIYWVEHPGNTTGTWQHHLIDTPGSSETGRLVDVNQDGTLDILPNGTKFAAWWELDLRKNADEKVDVSWLKHELPQELAGHGIGFGDVDGDGRGDLVCPKGWAQAPENRATGRWHWHDEFTLDRDGSVPIIVHDVDRDGDSDIVWGRGHNIGAYWMEQLQGRGGSRTWVRRSIDTSLSGTHSLLLADMDNDGQQDLVVGKRYLGHDGKDPGEYNPHVAYWYSFDVQQRVWQRHDILTAGTIGFGTDPKVVDLDADGDVDLLCGDRSGLFVLENLLVNHESVKPASRKKLTYSDHTSLATYLNDVGEQVPIKTPFDWGTRRDHILAGMELAMGKLPDSSRRVSLDVQITKSEKTESYVRHTITFAAEQGDRVPAFLLVPTDNKSKRPAMLCLHQTTAIGKGEPAGLGGKPTLHYAHELANRGYVCMIPDYPSFGDYKYDFAQKSERHVSGSMKAIWNNIRAVDVLESQPSVDRDHIGVIGHSLGGHNALFTAAFDQRLRAIVTSCGFTAFHHYYGGKLQGWTSDRYMPRIRTTYANDPGKVPFDFYEIVGALAPRPIFINAPVNDSNFDITGVKKVVAEAEKVYVVLGKPKKIEARYPDTGHSFPDDVREEAYNWLDDQLR